MDVTRKGDLAVARGALPAAVPAAHTRICGGSHQMHTSHGQPRLALLLLAILGVIAYCGAATTGAKSATASLTFANCSPSVVAYSFTLGGSGFAPGTQLEVTVQDNIFPGQFDQPFFP